MQAVVLKEIKHPLQLEERSRLEPAAGQVVVDLRAAALNRRDYWICQDRYPGIRTPVVLGSDGAGVVSAVGEGVDAGWLGAEVLLNPGFGWGPDPRAQDKSFHILGMPVDGTLAEQVAIDAEYLHAKPAHLTWPQTAALPVAAVTAYRAVVVQGAVEAGQTVLVTGVGGGVATFALQFATCAGARVLVTSSSSAKLDRARELGAVAGFDYTQSNWHQELLAQFGPVDLIIDGAAGPGYAALVELAGWGGRIVNYGATSGMPAQLDMFKVFWKQLTLQGTTLGSPDDFRAMLIFVSTHHIVPVVDHIYPLALANDALERLGDSQQFGKIVLRVSDDW